MSASLVHDFLDNVAYGVLTVTERGYPYTPLGLIGFHKPREASIIRDIGRGGDGSEVVCLEQVPGRGDEVSRVGAEGLFTRRT